MNGPLLLVAPIEPCWTGNGLSMRVAGFTESAARHWEVRVVVVPVAGHLPRPCPATVTAPVAAVPRPERRDLARATAALVADPRWRRLLADAGTLPEAARAASPALAGDVVRAGGVAAGTPVLGVRAYLAPLAVSVAEQLGAPWCALDLDDDDEELARAEGRSADAAAYRRLVATFGPRLGALSLAAPADAAALAQRHHLRTVTVPNAVRVPAAPPARRPEPGIMLFVANLTYPPNVEAATALVEGVLPALASRGVPRPRVLLVGPYDPDGPLRALRDRPDVTVTGFVDDLHDSYARAALVVAPIQHGSGTRIKLLEAFAHRVPVVTTPAGAAGLEVRHGEHLLLGATAGELAAAAAEVCESPALGASLAAAAYRFVRRHHDLPVMARQVRALLEAAAEGPRVS